MDYCTEYMDSLFLDEFKMLSEKKYETEHDVRVRIEENATVLPFVQSKNNSAKGLGGVLDYSGQYVRISATAQEDLMPDGYIPEKTDVRHYDETVVYLGYFIKQWGHFLVDFLPRLWWLVKNYKGEKVLILTSNPSVRIDGNYLEMLGVFGITSDKIHYVYEAEQYKQVIIPELSMQRPNYYSSECRMMFDYIVQELCRDANFTQYDRIYWTRTKLKKAQMTEIGEKDLENLFKRNGYKVLSPEKCSLREQVYHFRNCKEFVSLSGTIPHNIVFCNSGVRVIVINKTYRINLIQLLLNQFSGAEVIYIDAGICMLPASPGNGPFWVEIEDNILKFCHDNNFMIPFRYKKLGIVGQYISAIRKSRRLTQYIKMYCRLRDVNLDIGGEIVGKARPDSDFSNKRTYFFYREKLGYMNSDTNFISFATNLYHYFRRGAR